ncbi:MAG: universal stress protein [Gemmatimonadales bacterium]|nr:universal stress protein [Gemmatimonadales bacterium]
MPIKRILGATDGSVCGEHAVAVGRELARSADGEFLRFASDSFTGSEAERDTATQVKRTVLGVEIVRQAESWGADVVVLGRQMRPLGQPQALGPTTDAVIRRRSGLSLFVPPNIQAIRQATIAVDGTLRGLGVVPSTAAFLNLTGARASAVCVLPGTEAEATESSGWRDPRSEWTRALVGRLPLNSGPCELLLRWGNPVAEILRVLLGTGADLLVLGVRRGGRPGDLGSGHVGRELLESAPCAVLTVPI